MKKDETDLLLCRIIVLLVCILSGMLKSLQSHLSMFSSEMFCQSNGHEHLQIIVKQ